MTHTANSHMQTRDAKDAAHTFHKIASAATVAALLFSSIAARQVRAEEWQLYGTPVLDTSMCEIVDQELLGAPSDACDTPWSDETPASHHPGSGSITFSSTQELDAFDRDSGTKLASGPVLFVESDACTFTDAAKTMIAKAWSRLYTPNTGLLRSEAYKKRLARQIFDFDFYAGLSGADYNGGHEDTNTCRNLSDLTDTLANPRDFNYPVMGSMEGLLYWEELLDNDGLRDGLFPEVTNGATRFDAISFPQATAAELMFALTNTTYQVEFHCTTGDRPSAGAIGSTTGERYNWPSTGLSSVESSAGTIIHEAMHNRHFSHSCGRPQITARTADNSIDVYSAAPDYGWFSQRYASTTAVKGTEINAVGAVMPATLMSRWQRDINGARFTQPVHQTGPYVNSWQNYQLLYFKGYDQVRLYFGTLSTEARFDRVRIRDRWDNIVAQYSGEARDFWTPWIDGPEVKIEFLSDSSVPNFCDSDDDCYIGGYSHCNTTRNMCVEQPGDDKSFMGYEIVTYEGRGANNEHLTDLYRDSASDIYSSGWDTLTTYLHSGNVENRWIGSPNYIEPPERATVGETSESSINGTVNTPADRDVFMLWAPVGGEWPSGDVDYTVTFETNGDTDTYCRAYASTNLGIQEITSNDDGGDDRNCRLSFPISQLRSFSANPPLYWVEVGSYNSESTGDYEGVFTNEITNIAP